MKNIAQKNHLVRKKRSGLSGFGAFSILRKLESYGACAGKDGSPNCSKSYAIRNCRFCQYKKFRFLTILTKKGRKRVAMQTERHEPEAEGLKKISIFFKGNNFLELNHYFESKKEDGSLGFILNTGKVFVLLMVMSIFVVNCRTVDESNKYVLKENGKISCEIVVPEEAGPVALFAGEEMKNFLSQSLGKEIPLLKTPSGQKTAIILGNSQQAKDAGIDISKLARDAFVIKTNGRNILIVGRDDLKSNPMTDHLLWKERGTLFGVYEFLERFVGVRFYFPGELGTIIPKYENLYLPAINICDKPAFTDSRCFSYNAGNIDWLTNELDKSNFKRMVYLRLRLETKIFQCCHGLAYRDYVKRFKESHPEYLALMSNGKRDMENQFCFSSGIKDEIYKDAEAYFTGKSATSRGMSAWRATKPGYFDVMPMDGFYKCCCEKCQAHFSKGDQATTDFIWDFVAETANKLKVNGIKGSLTIGAYTCYRPIPTVNIPDNVEVRLSETGPWAMKNHMTSELEEILAWNKKLGNRKVKLWNYIDRFGKRAIPGIPASTPQAVGEYYKRVSPYVNGVFLQSNAETGYVLNNIHNYLNHYVFAKVAWNNSIDVDALLKEHHQLMFRAAAGPMSEIFRTIEKNWLEIVGGKSIDTPLGPQSIVLSDYEIWEKVYSEKEMERLERLFDESDRMTSADADSSKRVRFIREEFFKPILEERTKYLKNKMAINDLRLHVKELPAGTRLTVDGKIDEDAWKNAEQVRLVPYKSEKLKKGGNPGTIVRTLCDQKNIYFAFECEEPRMSEIVSSRRKDDDTEIWRDSSVEIFFNPSGDRTGYYQLIVNADGTLSDNFKSKNIASAWRWNSGASVAVFKGAGAWTAEIAIPVKNLQGLDFKKDFPVNFCRSRVLKKSATDDYESLFTWSPFLRNGFHDIDNFGYITFTGVQHPNIIKNASFETKSNDKILNEWILWKPSEFEFWKRRDDSFPESGKCLQLSRISAKEGSFSAHQFLPDLKPDTAYLLSFCIKIEGLVLRPNASLAGVAVNIFDDKNTWWPRSLYTSDMPWTRQGFLIQTGGKTNKSAKSYIRLCIANAKGTVYFGDVRLTETLK